ncbi:MULTISPECIES: hypothetical protein [unclassified Gilliamella]|uniref:hypothetical protein n=1 Tax=unclassified Gilliamella TaxID=2685620 RepID=UPI00080E77C9|nr:hypothetical protein [Gilliamella apicola]OCG38295.1 hypothetical protein A9G32_00170 [Gilliamella apicola]OCG49505.1 hypothetical protein A9G26_08485 [Gilliamella apicola]OCG50069.1 hypothetical protein A9G27_02290 [Gilliamella apicola]
MSFNHTFQQPKNLISLRSLLFNCKVQLFYTPCKHLLSLLKFFSSRLTLFTCIYLLLPANSAIALSATTNKVIRGSAPYLTFDGGATKITSVEGLLGIKLPNSSYIPPGINSALYPNAQVDTSNADNPIEMPNITDTFADIQTIVPVSNYPEVSLTNLVNAYGRDDDGDGSISASGQLTIKWQDKNGKDITNEVKKQPNKPFNICNAPYKLTLTATDTRLQTTYGIPGESQFSGASHSYYIKPNINKPLVCYAQPNLNHGTNQYAGPEEQWDQNYGFKVQDLGNASKNFPTTGANNLYFKLMLEGMTARQMIAINGNKVNPVSGTGITLSLSAENNALEGNIVRITLKGPTQNSMNKTFHPARFELYSDTAKKNLIYQFKIDRWFIVKPGDTGQNYNNALSFCEKLSSPQTYFVPAAQDYTNANGNGWNLGVPGQGNTYQRRISYWNSSRWVGGLFNEWGIIYDYHDAGWSSGDYWVIDEFQGRRYNVFAKLGDVDFAFYRPSSDRVACVAW